MKQTHQPLIEWEKVGDIPHFPFDDFEQLRIAVATRSFNIGVDSLAAAKWSEKHNTRFKKTVIAALSMLLLSAGAASVVAAVLIREYWLLAALPIQVVAFYFSHPASSIHKWVTVGGAVSVALFFNLLLNGLPIAATLVAYAGLTFAAVRAAGYITNSSFRKALLLDEKLFLQGYAGGACTLRNNRTKAVYST